MKIYILGGFLGSGKTTLLMKMADKLIEKGNKVSILVNEAGSIGVDGTTMKIQFCGIAKWLHLLFPGRNDAGRAHQHQEGLQS